MKTINDFNFNNKKAIIRVDFNVPLNNHFEVTDNNRIQAAKPTIDKITADGGVAVLMQRRSIFVTTYRWRNRTSIE